MQNEIIGYLQKAIDCLSCTYGDNVAGCTGTEERREFIRDMMIRLLGIQSEISNSGMFPKSVSCPYCGHVNAGISTYTYTVHICGTKDIERSLYACPKCRRLF